MQTKYVSWVSSKSSTTHINAIFILNVFICWWQDKTVTHANRFTIRPHPVIQHFKIAIRFMWIVESFRNKFQFEKWKMEKKNIVRKFWIDSDAFIACEFCLLGKNAISYYDYYTIIIIIQLIANTEHRTCYRKSDKNRHRLEIVYIVYSVRVRMHCTSGIQCVWPNIQNGKQENRFSHLVVTFPSYLATEECTLHT